MTIAVSMVNTEWAKANERAGAELLRRLPAAACATTAKPITAARTAQAMIDTLDPTGTETRAELLHKYPWPARSPNGQINTASVLDMQRLVRQEQDEQRAVCRPSGSSTRSYIDKAVAKLGPFVLENKDSKLAGCR